MSPSTALWFRITRRDEYPWLVTGDIQRGRHDDEKRPIDGHERNPPKQSGHVHYGCRRVAQERAAGTSVLGPHTVRSPASLVRLPGQELLMPPLQVIHAAMQATFTAAFTRMAG